MVRPSEVQADIFPEPMEHSPEPPIEPAAALEPEFKPTAISKPPKRKFSEKEPGALAYEVDPDFSKVSSKATKTAKITKTLKKQHVNPESSRSVDSNEAAATDIQMEEPTKASKITKKIAKKQHVESENTLVAENKEDENILVEESTKAAKKTKTLKKQKSESEKPREKQIEEKVEDDIYMDEPMEAAPKPTKSRRPSTSSNTSSNSITSTIATTSTTEGLGAALVARKALGPSAIPIH